MISRLLILLIITAGIAGCNNQHVKDVEAELRVKELQYLEVKHTSGDEGIAGSLFIGVTDSARVYLKLIWPNKHIMNYTLYAVKNPGTEKLIELKGQCLYEELDSIMDTHRLKAYDEVMYIATDEKCKTRVRFGAGGYSYKARVILQGCFEQEAKQLGINPTLILRRVQMYNLGK